MDSHHEYYHDPLDNKHSVVYELMLERERESGYIFLLAKIPFLSGVLHAISSMFSVCSSVSTCSCVYMGCELSVFYIWFGVWWYMTWTWLMNNTMNLQYSITKFIVKKHQQNYIKIYPLTHIHTFTCWLKFWCRNRVKCSKYFVSIYMWRLRIQLEKTVIQNKNIVS